MGKDASGGVGAGCGILALTNAVYYLNGSFLNPQTLAEFALRNGLRVNGVGTSHSFPEKAAQQFGVSAGFRYVKQTLYDNDLIAHLKSGGVALATVPNHFIAIVDYDASNNAFLVLDSVPSPNRGTSASGDWKTRAQINSGALSTSRFFLISKR